MASITNFLIELRRRNVFKVGVAYAIVAWLLLQVAATTFPALHLPPWSITLVTVLVILGFPLALIVVWAHGLTSDETVSVSVEVSNTGSADQQRVVDNEPVTSDNNSLPAIQKNESDKFSIVILPFEVHSQNAQDEELADGITTEVINAVGRTGAFDVASSHSSFAYKGKNKDTREVGRELDVNYVLEGSMRHAGNQIRLAIALIDTRSNRQVWAESYTHELDDLFQLQEQIGSTVAATLSSVLWRASMEEEQRIPSDNLDAAGFVDKSHYIFVNYSRRSFENGKELVRSVKKQKQQFGHADTLLAFILTHEVANAWTEEPEETRKEALAAADRVIDLEPQDTWVLGITSEALIWLGQAQRAVTLSERALTCAPDNLVHFAQAWLGNALLHVDRGEEGLEQIERALRSFQKEYFRPPWHSLFHCWAFTHLERYEEATLAGHKAVDRQTGTPFSSGLYANALAEIGQLDKARLAFADLKRLSPSMTLEHLEWLYCMAYESKEIAERYLCGLRKLDWS